MKTKEEERYLSVNTGIRSREFFQVTTFSCASFAEIAPFGRAIFAANINNGINVGYFHSLPSKERYFLRYRKKYVTVWQRWLKVLHAQPGKTFAHSSHWDTNSNITIKQQFPVISPYILKKLRYFRVWEKTLAIVTALWFGLPTVIF